MKHEGVVISADGGDIVVEINRASACGGCSEKKSCTTVDKETRIRLTFKNKNDLKVGDIVQVSIPKNSFYKSLFTIYIMPLIIMLLTAIILDKSGVDEITTAIATLFSAGAYFLVVHLFHKDKKGSVTLN